MSILTERDKPVPKLPCPGVRLCLSCLPSCRVISHIGFYPLSPLSLTCSRKQRVTMIRQMVLLAS